MRRRLHQRWHGPATAFTLIELMAVAALLAVATAVVAIAFAGVSDAQRLRATAEQITSIVRQVQSEAQMTGQPRKIEFTEDGEVTISRPVIRDGLAAWESAGAYRIARGASAESIVYEDGRSSIQSLRIDANGRFLECGLVLGAGDSIAAVMLSPWLAAEYAVLKPGATRASLDELRQAIQEAKHAR